MSRTNAASRSYPRFRNLDGRHSLRRAVPDGYVDYAARRRRDGSVGYFNFALAREMGLIPKRHRDRLDRELRRAILDAFALVIINEYDIEHGTPVSARDRLPHRYMATRYLQLQHPGRLGTSSGDGRSIWNGSITHRGVTWDVSSCGTGVTRLCPATANEQRFFKTGTRITSYGCGTAALGEGVNAALMSEAFHREGIATERVLAIISLPGGRSINVRAGRNLLRPSHFFAPLKQGNLEALRGVVDFFIERQIDNGDWPGLRGGRQRYRYFAEAAARTFARIAATFERQYIFCWLDWDGDNILADGGIIDYGSVRQFGLFHSEYRFRDEGRMSTSIREQRAKARRIVQNYAQIRDFLITGEKQPLSTFADDPILEEFDAHFQETKDRLLLFDIGFDEPTQALLVRHAGGAIERFERAHRYFERQRSARGPRRVADGITHNAIFSTRDLLREIPDRMQRDLEPLSAREFLDIAASTYASRRDRSVTPYRARRASEFQRAYRELLRSAARIAGKPLDEMLESVSRRSARINRLDRITGDSIEYASSELVRNRRKLDCARLYALIDRFVATQSCTPTPETERRPPPLSDPTSQRILDYLRDAMGAFRHSL